MCSAYIARRIIPDGNAYLVEGTGIGFNPHIEVNDFAWFWELFNEAHHFRDGFSEIRSQQVIKNLEKLAQSPDKIFFSEAEITAEDAPNDLRLPLKRTLTVQRVIRDSVIGKAQKQRYQYECQVCGTTIELPNGKRYAEAHHLRPVGKPHNGKDGFPNTIVVCPQHHAMFDLGAIAIEPESYLVKYWNKDEGKKNSRLILNHDLDPACVQYHHRKIFRGGGK